ncbi:MAG: DUF5106 domain-containing protein [Dysgonomonas sp.]|nr:DUF5106 domain-containing protein [Dysgonomonas sp.]
MRYIINITAILVLILSYSACTNDKGKESQESKEIEKVFPMVVIPQNYTTPKEKADFLVEHYWDNFDFTDTTYLNYPEVMGQAVATYAEVLPYTDSVIIEASINKSLMKASERRNMLNYFLTAYKKYFYDPNSPVRNEDAYIVVLKYIVKKEVDEAEKQRAQFDLDMLLKNRVGDKATDITYTLSTGNISTLYNLKSDYTILMFYNPDCESCEETIAIMRASPIISKLVQLKIASVLAFYPDRDLSIWEKHRKGIPSDWINGYDKNQEVEIKRLYDLKAIPTLYLLDRDKKVLLKDAHIKLIEAYLVNSNPMIFSEEIRN